MPAVRLQADGICGRKKLDLSPVRPLVFAICAETGPEAAHERRGAGTREPLFSWQIRGFLEATTQCDYRVFRV
ncbi:MAG: hypothetical protein DMF02_05780 [Verrucomicrobia bacterium]|nr:MAG: hypothetical protein DMF02_05780 [Verrucomicrobiota bacterium]